MEYTTVDRILAKFHRDLRGTDINESDAIEWIGEALEFLKVPQIQEQAVAFIEVKNNEAYLPVGLHLILQIARNNDWGPENEDAIAIPAEVVEEVTQEESCNPIPYKPYFDMQWQYINWTTSSYCQQKYTPVRLANNVFFKSLVCKEKTPYTGSVQDEYTIVGVTDKKLRFSFSEGQVAIAYLKNALDENTGYPLVPDNIRHQTAITYYVKWKIAERFDWAGREGWSSKADKAEQKWLKYVKQSNNYMKMPKTLDDYQDLLEESHHLIPKQKRYYNYFGNLGRPEDRRFNDPDNRNNNYGLNLNINM